MPEFETFIKAKMTKAREFESKMEFPKSPLTYPICIEQTPIRIRKGKSFYFQRVLMYMNNVIIEHFSSEKYSYLLKHR